MVSMERCTPGADTPVFAGCEFSACPLTELHSQILITRTKRNWRDKKALADRIRSEGLVAHYVRLRIKTFDESNTKPSVDPDLTHINCQNDSFDGINKRS